MLQLKDVEKRFRKKEVLKKISLDLEDGVYGLLGPNGSGKTTMMRCILNIYRLNGGSILYEGENVAADDSFLKHVGYLPQKFGLFRELTVREMIGYLASLKKLPKEQIPGEVERCVELVNLSDRLDKKVRTLSGGMIRRLGIAPVSYTHLDVYKRQPLQTPHAPSRRRSSSGPRSCTARPDCLRSWRGSGWSWQNSC